MATKYPKDGEGNSMERLPRSRAARASKAAPRMARAIDYAHGAAARAEAARTMSLEEEAAIARAREGDPSQLLPYAPTPSINPPRPRTTAAGYSRETETLRIQFRNGAIYEYYDVPPRVYRNFRRVKSPGRAINRTLNAYNYARRPDLEA